MEIKISKCSSKCHACETDFAHEEKIHSVARTNDAGLERLDYCRKCYSDTTPGPSYCSWGFQYSDPKVMEAERQEAFSPLRRLFYDLAASEERADLARAFLAAQLLKRQKVFRQIREVEEGEGTLRVSLFLNRVGNRLIEAKDLNFTYTELDDARVLLLEQLRRLETPESESAPVPDAGIVTGGVMEPETQVEDHGKE